MSNSNEVVCLTTLAMVFGAATGAVYAFVPVDQLTAQERFAKTSVYAAPLGALFGIIQAALHEWYFAKQQQPYVVVNDERTTLQTKQPKADKGKKDKVGVEKKDKKKKKAFWKV